MGRDVGHSSQMFSELGAPSFSAVVQGFTPAATPTDFATLVNPTGSGKVLIVTEVWLNGVATAASIVDIWLYKRTALDTGGTTAAITVCPYDSAASISTPTGTPFTYSVNPTGIGTGTILRQAHVLLGTLASPTVQHTLLDYQFDGGTPLMPRIRQGECLAWNYGGVALGAGTVLDFGFEWCELPIIDEMVRY